MATFVTTPPRSLRGIFRDARRRRRRRLNGASSSERMRPRGFGLRSVEGGRWKGAVPPIAIGRGVWERRNRITTMINSRRDSTAGGPVTVRRADSGPFVRLSRQVSINHHSY